MSWIDLRKCFLLAVLSFAWGSTALAESCSKPIYLTFDTGHMEIAPLVADVLKRQKVKVTFFAANEDTKVGDGSLGDHWAYWWRERAREGHAFASHTWDHTYWRGDIRGSDGWSFRVQPSAGHEAGKFSVMTSAQYCTEIRRASDRLRQITGVEPLRLFRAPGGKVSERSLQVARACGFEHVGWSSAGFLGDELPSERYSNQSLLKQALRNIRQGDILLAHLGIWSRKDPWAPEVLEPLIVGLKLRGFCFLTLKDHPVYGQ